MIEFINQYSTSIFLALEILAAVTGIILYEKYRYTAVKYFIYFLIYVVIFVLLGRYTHYVRDDGFLNFLDGTLLERNYWWFTIFWDIGGATFFGWYYQKILVNRTAKNILKISVILFLIVSTVSIVVTLPDFFKMSLPIINILGALIILQCVFYYFLEILKSDEILNFYKSMSFYISCAILILWLVQTSLVFFEPYFRKEDMEFVYLRGYINLFVISFMYLTYTIGLIVSDPDYD